MILHSTLLKKLKTLAAEDLYTQFTREKPFTKNDLCFTKNELHYGCFGNSDFSLHLSQNIQQISCPLITLIKVHPFKFLMILSYCCVASVAFFFLLKFKKFGISFSVCLNYIFFIVYINSYS